MGDEKGKSEEIEPSFNMDEWMKELLPDDDEPDATEIGMGRAGMPLPSSNVNSFNHKHKSGKLEESYQVAATASNIIPNICQNLKQMNPTSGIPNNNIGRQNMQGALFTRYTDISEGGQNSSNMVSQLHQRQQFQNQVLKQPAQRSNMHPLSMHSNSHPSNERQQRPIQKQSTAYGMLQQQQMIGNQSSPLMMKYQESFNYIQHSDLPISDKSLIQMSQRMQMQQAMDMRSCLGVQTKLQTTAFPHSQNLMTVDQQMPANQSQPIHVAPSQGYSSQVGLTNSSDWVDPAFRQIQFLKEMYISDLIKLFEKTRGMRHQVTNTESAAKVERTINFTEKVIRFLHTTRMDLTMNYRKEKVYKIINEVMIYLDRAITGNHDPMQLPHQLVEVPGSQLNTPQMQQRGSILQFNTLNQCLNSTRTSTPQSLRQHGGLNMQTSPGNSFQVGSSSVGLKQPDASSMNAHRFSLMRPTRSNMVSSTHKGSQRGFEQKALSMLLHPTIGTVQSQNTNLSSVNQRVASSRNVFNSLDASVSSLTQNSMLTSTQQNKRQDQATQMQKLKQPLQQFLSEKNKHQMVQKMNDDSKLGYMLGFNQKMPCLTLQQSSSSSYHVGSPQNSQHSSARIEPKDLSSTFSNSTTPLLSTSSPMIVPSPLTPLTPSSVPVDSEKCPSCFHPLSLEENRIVPTTPAAPAQLQDANKNQSLNDTLGLQKSPLLAESSSQGVKPPSRSKEDPLKHLVEVVKSISTRVLNASLWDMDAVTNVTERTAGSPIHGESRRIIVRDLADDIRNYGDGNFSLIHGTGMETRMKRRMSTMAFDDMTSEMEFNAVSRIKRLKKENLILQELKEINQTNIEVAMDVMNTTDVLRAKADKGILIRCCYNPVGLAAGSDTELTDTSRHMFPTLLLELIVTPDYPNTPPVVLETLPPDYRDNEEGKDLWMKAKSNFSLLLRKCSEPISLKEMARTWDACAREVFHEFALQKGGGGFSSRYGEWENCIAT